MNPELVKNGEEGEEEKPENRQGVTVLRSWLNKNMKVKMSDGRFLVGIFLCTDRAGNVIIGSCNEYTCDPDQAEEENTEEQAEARILGLALVPGHHVTRMWVDLSTGGSRRTNSPLVESDEGL